jgi:hypothetical protein
MKKGIVLWLAIMAGTAPAHAGHRTIVETDTAFIVDYADEANGTVADKVVVKAGQVVASEAVTAAQPAAPAPPAAVEQPAAAKAPKHFAGKHDIPRQRRGTRTGPWHRLEAMVDTPSDSEE